MNLFYKLFKPNRGYVYVVTSSNYAKDDIYKIGYTNDIERRLKQFNMSRIEADKMFVQYKYFSENARDLETDVHHRLKKYRLIREFYKCPLSIIIDNIHS